MKKTFLISLIVISLLAVSVVYGAWYDIFKITGNPIADASALCTDSDNLDGSYAKEDDEFEAGYVTIQGQISYDSCNGRYLTEYYCSGRKAKTKKIFCNSGCVGETLVIGDTEVSIGKCQKPVTICREYEAQNTNPHLVKGSVVETFISSRELKDTCANKEILSEYSCIGNNEPAVLEEINCTLEYGTICSKGACGIPTSAQSTSPTTTTTSQQVIFSCGDTDLTDPNDALDTSKNSPGTATRSKTVNGVITSVNVKTDRCENSKKVREYYCDGNEIKSKIETCEDICQGEACIVRPDVCTDSDNGKNFDLKGTVTTEKTIVSDFCIDENILMELGCREKKGDDWAMAANSKTSTRIDYTLKKCANGCSEGVCCPQGGCIPVVT